MSNSLSPQTHRAGPLAAWLLCGLALLTTPQTLTAKEFDDITVSVESTPRGQSVHGYVEYRISITNRSSGHPRQVRLILPDTDFTANGNWIRHISRTVLVGPASTVDVPLWQPPVPMYGRGLAVEIDGERQEDPISLNISQHGGGRWAGGRSSGQHPVILLSRDVLNLDFQSQAHQALQNAAGELGLDAFPSELPVTDWSRGWLGYSSYDGVVVTSSDLKAMPSSVRSALWRSVESGGSLMIVGSWEVPQPWDARRVIKDGLAVYYVGFGLCFVTDDPDLNSLSQIQWQHLNASWSETRSPWSVSRNAADANKAFPVVEEFSIPVRGLFLLMLFFVAIIGPLNLMLLSRRRKRIWLLWTVPAISLITCVVVSAYALFSEGWSGQARAKGLTILDEVSHRATTIGWAAFYAPLTPGQGLHYSYDTELTPQIWTSFRSSGTARAIDWTRDQHLTLGWVPARVPAHFMIRKSEVRRERLTVRKGSHGALTVVNGLGADIGQLWLADEDERIYTATGVKAGAEAILRPKDITVSASGSVDDLRRAFMDDWTGLPERLASSPNQFLRPGCYIAWFESSPFMEEGLHNLETRTTQAVVYGIGKK